MEEGKRILSLRKKRSVKPKISAPKQISAPISQPPLPTQSLQLPSRPSFQSQHSNSSVNTTATARPRADGHTADYVKRRYSTKIPQLPPGFGEAPALPSVPSQFLSTPPARSEARGARGYSAGDPLAVDLQALHNPDLKPEQYVSHLLAQASESDILSYQSDLIKIKHRTSTDLQHNVYQNRSQFIKISQEADKLKAEMRTLRSLMSDLNGTLGQTNAALGIDTSVASSARKYANRSSVANLEAMWSSHLQELWRRVEGSQKFLPAIPGRHVVYESGRWVELNTATWKPKRRVHLILLNDHLLIASEKKRLDAGSSPLPDSRAGKAAPQVLSADKCFPVSDIDMDDLAQTRPVPSKKPSTTSPSALALNVRVGPDSYTFAATDPDGSEKASFLARFRKASAEMKKSLRVSLLGEREPSRERAPRAVAGGNGLLPAEGVTAVKSSMLVEVDGRQQEFRWLETQCDELDIDIALQRFESAVRRVDTLRRVAKSNKSNLVVADLTDTRVQSSAGRLSKAIIRQMRDTNSRMTATQQHIAWLIKLGFEARASEAYLDSRSEVVRMRVGQSSNLGDLHQYIYQLSFIYFTLIKNTIAIYQACFAHTMTSACIKWAKDHVDEFNSLLARQMRKWEPRGDDWRMALDRVREHERMLREVNVDMGGMIGRGLEGEAA